MTTPALTWEIRDGIAIISIDRPGEPVNTISSSVKEEFLSCFATLEQDTRLRAMAFFSGKPDNFIAGADIEEFVRLGSSTEAERLSADGQAMLDRVVRFPKPIAVGIHGACLQYGKRKDGRVSYLDGANVAGFVKVAEARP